MTESTYTKKKSKGTRIYSINWSNYLLGTKLNVLKKLTEMTGVFVIFYVNKYNRLAPCMIGGAWYTGFRPTLLKLFSRLPSDVIPLELFNRLEYEKVYIKHVDIYDLDDFTDILYSVKEKYPNVFFDNNGIPPPAHNDAVKTIDENTRIYYKK